MWNSKRTPRTSKWNGINYLNDGQSECVSVATKRKEIIEFQMFVWSDLKVSISSFQTEKFLFATKRIRICCDVLAYAVWCTPLVAHSFAWHPNIKLLPLSSSSSTLSGWTGRLQIMLFSLSSLSSRLIFIAHFASTCALNSVSSFSSRRVPFYAKVLNKKKT